MSAQLRADLGLMPDSGIRAGRPGVQPAASDGVGAAGRANGRGLAGRGAAQRSGTASRPRLALAALRGLVSFMRLGFQRIAVPSTQCRDNTIDLRRNRGRLTAGCRVTSVSGRNRGRPTAGCTVTSVAGRNRGRSTGFCGPTSVGAAILPPLKGAATAMPSMQTGPDSRLPAGRDTFALSRRRPTPLPARPLSDRPSMPGASGSSPCGRTRWSRGAPPRTGSSRGGRRTTVGGQWCRRCRCRCAGHLRATHPPADGPFRRRAYRIGGRLPGARVFPGPLGDALWRTVEIHLDGMLGQKEVVFVGNIQPTPDRNLPNPASTFSGVIGSSVIRTPTAL